MPADRHRLRRQLRAIREAIAQGRPSDERLARWKEDLRRSIGLREARRAGVPAVRFDDELPVARKRHDIAAAIREHPVVVVCGETGSGKSTQLPKICLELGRGIDRVIGHTQPRRIAARSVAARIAEELGSPLGHAVGYKIRFTDETGPRTYVKLMTDGILLAESQGDPFLDQYDTIILDEAHERSLNVDFLIGYLKGLLPRRRDLKLVITSATIDAARFAGHFATPAGPAPVIEVTGRSYPVEVRWRPLAADEEGHEPELEQAIADVVDELARIDRGNVLVFMPTERDIHELAKVLRGRTIPGDAPGRQTEILPLYARLSIDQQQRVFHPGAHRRIVIATNVAESSLTVPGIRYVIDPGTARISRYSARTKTQRLPIEPVSQASADQRKGRCGRIAPGICVRLYSEEDYLARDRYTAPEIQRTNLASVILQTKALRLGPIEEFPFLDPPRSDAVRDGYRTLLELGALDEEHELTEVGRQLARLPVDPRIGRMILAAADEGCLTEVLVIAAALEAQDPRDRPLEKQEAADACHARFADPDSDFLVYLKLWDFYHRLKAELSRGQLRKACREHFLSYNRMREWADVHLQLRELVQEAGMKPRPRTDEYNRIHRAILAGLLSNVAVQEEKHQYTVAGGGKALLWPGSGIFAKKPRWIVAAELVETARRYLRTCARINTHWVESVAAHVVRRDYSDAYWDPKAATPMVLETVSLFGLTLVAGRHVRYGPIDPEAARELLVQHGLVEGKMALRGDDFLSHNQKILAETERLAAKLRRNDLMLGQWARFEFYDRRVPAGVYEGSGLWRWLSKVRRSDPEALYMSRADLLREDARELSDEGFPDVLEIDGAAFPLEYRFEPGSDEDGVTLAVPLDALGRVDPRRLEWLVPGLLEAKVIALVRSLPKPIRRGLVPAPQTAKNVLGQIRFGEGDFLAMLAGLLGRIGGQHVPRDAFQLDKLPAELRMNVRVRGEDGQTLAQGRDLAALRRQLNVQAAAAFSALDEPRWHRDGITAWDFDDLPAEIELVRGGLKLRAYPMLVDRQDSVALRLAESPERAARESRHGLRRLVMLGARREIATQVDWLPGLDRMLLSAGSVRDFDLRRQLADLVADRAFFDTDRPIPRTKPGFDELVEAGRERIGVAVQEVLERMGPMWEAYHQARLATEQVAHTKWQYAADDVRRQLDWLTGPDFLTATPWTWLVHYPRFFRAIPIRLDALRSGGLARDRRATEEIDRRWQGYLDAARRHDEQGLDDPELALYRWMLEEYRVSLFAQRLGTSIPASAKRLDRQWSKVRSTA